MTALTPPEWFLLLCCAAFLLAGVARAFGWTIRQDAAPQLRHRPHVELPRIRPEEDAERLISGLALAPRAGLGILAGDVTVSAYWSIDAGSPILGSYRVQIGDRVTYATDVDVVYSVVRERLAAIVEERRVARRRS